MRELFVGLLLWMVIPAGLVAAQEDAPKSDAEYVVEQLASSELFEVSMEAMGDLLAQSIDLELRKSDKLLSPDSLAWISDQMGCLLYTSPSPRDQRGSRMPSSA